MEGAEGNRDKFNLSLRMNGLSGDPLHKFMKQSHCRENGNERGVEDEADMELSLGLSMNGRFGVDPSRKKLKRSSSISDLVFTIGAVDNGSSYRARGPAFDGYAPLVRTHSLPTEAEEEWRRRKEFQSMRRMEARKKRMEKLRNVRVVKDKENCSGDVNYETVNGSVNGQRLDFGIAIRFEDGNGMSSPQGSIGSQGSGSSGTSDLLTNQTEAGLKQNAEVPPSSVQEQGEQESAVRATDRDVMRANTLIKNAMLDMPYVTTKEDGPNGHKIEGFLYRYRKGEEVRIVCVCHGMFLSPAEFVKHGGGGDVEHPLKHIVVNLFLSCKMQRVFSPTLIEERAESLALVSGLNFLFLDLTRRSR
ncbi:UNVERIFIED_CONTAM: Ninja-family protein AFP3 [Sesamum angustifolium]|uniref:Ninja-family protein n=1 Tax=Sesamum angustifolium TaxID=2727405 RepID=A0AAW2NLB4_9LAMI